MSYTKEQLQELKVQTLAILEGVIDNVIEGRVESIAVQFSFPISPPNIFLKSKVIPIEFDKINIKAIQQDDNKTRE